MGKTYDKKLYKKAEKLIKHLEIAVRDGGVLKASRLVRQIKTCVSKLGTPMTEKEILEIATGDK